MILLTDTPPPSCFFTFIRFYYRAMHFSAKRGIAIACRLSVRLSVTLVNCDHIGWNCSKIISAGTFAHCNPNTTGLLQGEHPSIWAQSDPPPVDLSVGDIRLQIAPEWLHIAQRSQWRAYRKPPSIALSNGVIADPLRPLLPPKMGVPYAPICERPYLCNGW